MKIAIDISQIIYETGVSVYTRELVSNLVKLYPKEEFIFFGGSLRRGEEIKSFAKSIKKNAITTPLSPTMADFLWNRLHVLNIEKLIGEVDIFHSSDWAEPPAECAKATTIHDLAPLLFPELSHPKIVETHRRKLSWVAKESKAVIVPSVQTKSDAIELGISEKVIKVIPEGLRADIKKSSSWEIQRVRKKYKIDGNYAISVGNNPRKNTERIISAFNAVKGKAGMGSLVVVGGGASNEKAIFTGHVSNSELFALYSGAEVLVYPSLYEGFGLPILEAFACEIPVVTSNISSMPEVAGKAAILVNPKSTKSISDGILEALEKKKILVSRGKAQVKKFSWENTAKKTMEVYRSLV